MTTKTPSTPPEDSAAGELFRAIAEYTYDWETWVDHRGQTRWVNPAVQRITGYSVDECLALGPDYPARLAHTEDLPILNGVLDDAARGGSGNDVEFRVRAKDGRSRWVAISWQAVRARDGASLGYRTSVRDIDERKRMEEQLFVLRRRAEALAQARSELLANVSHELRSPIHCISGFVELLRESPLQPIQSRYVTLIADQCQAMLRQVEDLLSLTALEAGGVELVSEPLDLEALCQGVVDAAQLKAQAGGLSLDLELELDVHWVEGDVLRLGQILRNLVDNAIKFTPEGHVSLSARTRSSEPDCVLFRVQDTGTGMEAERVAELLEPFRQGRLDAAQRMGGVGLGLAIVDRLVRAMGGRVDIRSQPAQGTCVELWIPLSHRDGPHASSSVPTPHSERREGTALVVDDSATARELLVAMLGLAGFSALEADSAERAVAVATRTRVDVVFLDYQMPRTDGAQAALTLRRLLNSREPLRHVPIFVLTANVFASEQFKEAKAAVDGILSKPLSRAALARVLGGLDTLGVVPGAALSSAQAGEEATLLQGDEGVAPAPRRDDKALVDVERLRELGAMPSPSGGSLLTRLLATASADADTALRNLGDALAKNDTLAQRRALHAMGGVAQSVGAAALAVRCRELEASAVHSRHFADLQELWRDSMIAIRMWDRPA